MEKSVNMPLTIALLLLVLTAGCTQGAKQEQPLISISPAVLDFGKVRPADSPVKLTFNILNNDDRSLLITDILAGCSCTVADIPKEPIPPKGNVDVTVSINIWGQSGNFEDSLVLKISEGSTLRVPVQGNIDTDIWTVGQALRSTIGRDEKSVSAVLTVYTTKYPDIVFAEGPQAHGLTLTEISRITQSGETAIRLAVDLEVESDLVVRHIKVIPVDSSIAPLTVPFYVHRIE